MRRSIADRRNTVARAGGLALLFAAAALLSGCETDGTLPGPFAALNAQAASRADKPPEPPMTRTRAAADCWMKTEKGSAGTNLDKRADAVNKCIDEKMKAAQAAPKS